MERQAGRAAVMILALVASCPATAQVPAGANVPFKAAGNEPGWTLDVGADRITFVTDYGKTRVVTPLTPPTRIDGGRRYETKTDTHTLTITITEKTCVDSMSGMPRPASVEVSLDGRVLQGCGGDPTALLRGAEWIVRDVNGRALVAKSRITMAFGAGGRVQGSTTCNKYTAGYVLTGESLTMSMPIATIRGCDPPLMEQERLFLEVLRSVQRFELEDRSTLVLHGGDGGSITAHRP